MGISCKCTPESESSPLGGEELHFYWMEEVQHLEGHFIQSEKHDD